MKLYRLVKVVLLVSILAVSLFVKTETSFSFASSDNPLKIEKIIGLSENPGTFRTVSTSGWDLEPNGQQGVVVASDGTIYIGDGAEGQIEMFSKEMKSIGNFGTLGTGDGQFQYITSMAIDKQDQLYVVDSFQACIQLFTKEGTFVKRFGERGVAPNQLNVPVDISVMKSGEILVEDLIKGLKVFSKDGNYLREFSSDPKIQPKENLFFEEVEVDSEGYVYVYLYDKDAYEISIVRFDSTGKLIGSAVDIQPDKGRKYASVFRMAIDEKYFYIFCYSGKATIRRYEILPDPTKKLQFVDVIIQASEDRFEKLLPTDFINPISLFVKNGILYYLDGTLNRLVSVSSDKTYLGTIQSPLMSTRGFYEKLEKKPLPLGFLRNPQGVRFDSTGRMFVGNSDYSCVSVFDPSGKPIANIGNMQKNYGQIALGELDGPTDMAFDQDGNIFITDTGADVVQVFNKSFTPVSTNRATFNAPQGIVFDSNNRLLVVNSGSAIISSLENDSSIASKYKQVEQYPIEGKWPVGIDVFENDDMVVGVTQTDTVQILSPDGELIKTIGEFGKKPGQLSGPQGVMVDSAGNIYVVETDNGRIQKFTKDGSLLWCSELKWMGLTFIAQDSSGKLYVTDCTHGVVLVISDSTAVPPVPKKQKPVSPSGNFYFALKDTAGVKVGDVITLLVKVGDVNKVESLNLSLTYSAENLYFKTSRLGAILKNNKFQTVPAKEKDNKITISAASLDGSNYDLSGNLFEIDFQAKAAGVALIKFDEIILKSAGGKVVPPKSSKELTFAIDSTDTTPPLLTVEPIPSFVYDPILLVSGKTEPSANLTVNKNIVTVEKDGSFKTQITLIKGKNAIEIIATDLSGNKTEFKKEVTLEEHIVVKLIVGSNIIIVNGSPSTMDATPFIDKVSGRTMVPVIAFSTGFGVKVEFEPKTRQIKISKEDVEIVVWVGKPKALVNGKEVNIDNQKPCSPAIVKGRTYLPLRFIGESLKCKIDWDSKTQTITLSR